MSDPVRRGLRTLLQVGTVQAIIALLVAFGVRFTVEQIAAITTISTPLLSLAQNLLEDHTGFPAILKAPASSGQNPVGPESDHV